MQQGYALKPDAGDIRGLAIVEAAQVNACASRVLRMRRKGVFENALKHGCGGFVSVEREAAGMAKTQRP